MERRSQGFHSQNSDEEEDEESYQARRRGASVDDFLRGSELGRQVWQLKWLPYHTTTGIRGKCQHWMFRSVVLAYVFVFSQSVFHSLITVTAKSVIQRAVEARTSRTSWKRTRRSCILKCSMKKAGDETPTMHSRYFKKGRHLTIPQWHLGLHGFN